MSRRFCASMTALALAAAVPLLSAGTASAVDYSYACTATVKGSADTVPPTGTRLFARDYTLGQGEAESVPGGSILRFIPSTATRSDYFETDVVQTVDGRWTFRDRLTDVRDCGYRD